MAMNEKKMAATMLECPYPKQIMDIKYVDILTGKKREVGCAKIP